MVYQILKQQNCQTDLFIFERRTNVDIGSAAHHFVEEAVAFAEANPRVQLGREVCIPERYAGRCRAGLSKRWWALS